MPSRMGAGGLPGLSHHSALSCCSTIMHAIAERRAASLTHIPELHDAKGSQLANKIMSPDCSGLMLILSCCAEYVWHGFLADKLFYKLVLKKWEYHDHTNA